MRALGVLVVDPSSEDRAGLVDREEQRLVEQFVEIPTIEALDVAVLRRLARCDEMPLDASFALLGEHAFEVSSMPLSLTIIFSAPRSAIRSASSRTTLRPGIDVHLQQPLDISGLI